MRVRQVESPRISDDGRWVAFSAAPDRGNPEGIVREAGGDGRWTVERGTRPVIAPGGEWVAFRLEPPLEDRLAARKGDDAPRAGLAVLRTADGDLTREEEVREFAFSGDGRFLAWLHHPPQEEEEGEEDEDEEGSEEEGEAREERPSRREEPGTRMVLLKLETGERTTVEEVKELAFDQGGRWLAYVSATSTGEGDGIHLRDLRAGRDGSRTLESGPFLDVHSVTWWEEGERLGWISGENPPDGHAEPAAVRFWDGEVRTAAEDADAPDGWHVATGERRLGWSEDGERLFLGLRPDAWKEDEDTMSPSEAGAAGPEANEAPADPYDLDAIVRDRALDVWHTADPFIIPHQKEEWEDRQRQAFRAVFHLDEGRLVQLGDTAVQLAGTPDNPRRALATGALPYRKQVTWVGELLDLWVVDLEDGERRRLARALQPDRATTEGWLGGPAPAYSLSPEGGFAAFWQHGDWHLADAATGELRNLTAGMDVPFADVDHDYPNPAPGYPLGGWVEGGRAVLIHDKYDLWRFPTDGGAPVNVTGGEGRRARRIFRVMETDPEREALPSDGWIHLRFFDETDKSYGFARTRPDREGVEGLLDEEKRYAFLARAEDADVYLYTREDYDEFPDLWVAAAPDFSGPRKLTDVNPGIREFGWGTSELVEWISDDGLPLQGVVIKPAGYEEGKRYPVLTYFYRFMSHRLHEFNEPVVNHRPSFPIYASDGYIVFLPDVRFEVGRPGLSSMKSVVPGVKKLVDMGLADPDALGLHGHSWSGYTTAYIVTQTDIFAAAVAGAPVSNMTSAYGGIRWGSGLARQFQYEQSQSRLSGSLWEARQDYIENSPLFYADRIDTPLLIQHGDEDGAVPWYQSIELYLALRRLGKEAVFLQYRDEPHHLQKYPNKLDYSMKMKAFFDHFLKGAPAPEWWTEGVPYRGK